MILHVLIVLCLIGFLLWLVNSYLPMDSKVKTLLNVVVTIVLVLWLLRVFGVLSYLGHLP